ncbi:MAG: prepilin-type N-terminal cleavage/methylation domain-containing protein [Patescibacteria group bacterium]|nr:prepilin-type N-terminal cleavage/methylation domain-containing protein [Patescibacteria group bacterium]
MKLGKISESFTLIELLIVIALLGALAVGLLAALDPFEQLKKGTDTGVRNTVSELHGAMIRYYAIKNQMPWCTSTSTNCADLNEVVANTLTDTINRIVQTGELKTDFIQLAGNQLQSIFVTGKNDPPTVVVCYKPTSKSFASNPNTKYKKNGDLEASCPTGNPASECYYCVR